MIHRETDARQLQVMVFVDFVPTFVGKYEHTPDGRIVFKNRNGNRVLVMRFENTRTAIAYSECRRTVIDFPCDIEYHIEQTLNTHFNEPNSIIDTDDIARNFCYEVNYRNLFYRGPVAHLKRAYTDNMHIYVPNLHRVMARIAHEHAIADGDNSKYATRNIVYIHRPEHQPMALEVIAGRINTVMHDPMFDFGPPIDYLLSKIKSGVECHIAGMGLILMRR